MISVDILYPKTETSTFDLDYYLTKHIPMVIDRLGSPLRGITVKNGLANATPGAALPYAVMCHLRFDSVEAFQAAFGPCAAELQGDIPNYTNVTPVIQLSDVKIFR